LRRGEWRREAFSQDLDSFLKKEAFKRWNFISSDEIVTKLLLSSFSSTRSSVACVFLTQKQAHTYTSTPNKKKNLPTPIWYQASETNHKTNQKSTSKKQSNKQNQNTNKEKQKKTQRRRNKTHSTHHHSNQKNGKRRHKQPTITRKLLKRRKD